MPIYHLTILTRTKDSGLPLEVYKDMVLERLRHLFGDSVICCDYGLDSTRMVWGFDIITDHNPFHIKRECMRLEKRDKKRIGDVDVYFKTSGGLYKERKISRDDRDFIRWSKKNDLKELEDRFRACYLSVLSWLRNI